MWWGCHGAWWHCSNTSRWHKGVKLPHVDISRVCGGTWSVVVFRAPASESIDASCFETSSGVRMLIFVCRGCPHDAVPAPTLHDPRNLVSVVGNEPRPHGPCRCVTAAPPTWCARAGGPKVQAMGPPAGCHCKRPRPGARDVRHPQC